MAPVQAPVAQSFDASARPRSETLKAYLDMIGGGGGGDVLRAPCSVLRAGPLVSPTTIDSLPANVRMLREQLVGESPLVPQDGCLRLRKDTSFASPSPAPALVEGRSSTGPGDWIRVTDRKRLGDGLRERDVLGEGAMLMRSAGP
ncbi:DUF4357 domain-containing protein [uncultured Methylobacterium sp.]|uniref:DUF4357 domain-containing protein n=1 Tax=uncultured Methylobacterium sp. TaxID=157278 RepID=UPI0025948EC9|nr:DUF4357 domain-containing protein [uncultured Methylobacterium sp.]